MGFPFDVFLEDGPIYVCHGCGTHLSYERDLVSTAFRGRTGAAWLFNKVWNVSLSLTEDRMMTTGLHAIADAYCNGCNVNVGWKYSQVYEESQKYKKGKFILEKELVESIVDPSAASRVSEGRRRSRSSGHTPPASPRGGDREGSRGSVTDISESQRYGTDLAGTDIVGTDRDEEPIERGERSGRVDDDNDEQPTGRRSRRRAVHSDMEEEEEEGRVESQYDILRNVGFERRRRRRRGDYNQRGGEREYFERSYIQDIYNEKKLPGAGDVKDENEGSDDDYIYSYAYHFHIEDGKAQQKAIRV